MFILNKQSFLAKIAIVAMCFAMFGYKLTIAQTLIIGDGGNTNSETEITIPSSDYDELNINKNGSVTNTYIQNDGFVLINGGTATNTEVDDGGVLQINSGSANTVNVLAGGYVSTYDDENSDGEYGSITNLTVDKDGGYILSTNSEVTSAKISSSTITEKDGSIDSSKKASNILVNENSTLIVEAGGSAVDTVVDGGELEVVGAGATAESTTVLNGGDITIENASANVINVRDSGTVFVSGDNNSSKGSVSDITLNDSAALTVDAYGEANSVTLNGNSAKLVVNNNGAVSNATINGAVAEINGTLNNSSVKNGGTIVANLSGSVINGLSVEAGSKLDISTNATISDLKDSVSGASLGSISANIANGIVVTDGSVFTVNSSGAANNTTVKNGGTINATENGATINDIKLEDGAVFNFTTDITASSITVNGTLTGATIQDKSAHNVEIGTGSTLTVVNGGTSNDTVVSGGKLIVETGTASGGTVSNGGTIQATSSNATVSGVNIAEGGYFDFSTDANVSATYGDQQIIIQDKTASSVIIGDGSVLSVDNGGSAVDTLVDGGTLAVSSGVVSATTVQDGTMNMSGGEAYGLKVINTGVVNATAGYITPKNPSGDEDESFAVTIADGGTINLSGSATIESAEISNGGKLNVNSGGKANNTTIKKDGILNIDSGGVAELSSIQKDGQVVIKNGGKLSSVVIADGASVTGAVGAILENITALNGANLDLETGSKFGGYLIIDADANFTGSLDMSTIFSADNSDLNSLTLKNGFNEAFNHKVVNTDTSSNKTLELTDGDYTISNSGEDGASSISGWDSITLSNATVRIESDVVLTGENKEFVVNNDSMIDISGTAENSVQVAFGGNLTNNGIIDFTKQGDSATDEIIIDGNYIGGNNSKIYINVNPAANTADKLTVNGNVSGNTGLYLQTVSPSVPSGNILLVDAPNNTVGDASSFNIWRVEGSPFTWDILFENNKWYGYVTDADTPSIVPEVAAYYGLIDNTFMQTASLGATLRKNIAESELRKVACKTNKKLKYNNRICRGRRPVFTGWIAPVYSSSKVQTPYNYTASIAGFDGGLDIFSNETTKLGLLASYRQGHYNYEQNGSNYVIKGDAVTTINSYLAGLYIRHDGSSWSILSAIYAGNLDGSISTNDGVESDVSGTTLGATLDINYIWQNIKGIRIEPGVRISYTSVKLDEVKDNAEKIREFDNASRNEIEAGIRFAKRWVYPEAKAEIFFKPSIVQTINSGGQFELIEERMLDSTEDLTLAKIEAGMSFDMVENWSASLAGAYSFGSNYQNTTANLSLIYNF